MNYRHIYHAGNFADVFKHWVLTLILTRLCQKEAPFFLLDTQAGLGFYDLEHTNAQNTLEYQTGIAKILVANSDPIFDPYLDVVRRFITEQHIYPGSAAIMQYFLRDNDRLLLNELHKDDYVVLRENFQNDKRVKIFNDNAYQCLKAVLPPKERRGLIFLDPAFEIKDELTAICTGLAQALKRFATGIYVVWYPIKDRKVVDKFYRSLTSLAMPPTLITELHANENLATQLSSCGLIIVNPPWQLAETLGHALPKLVQALNFKHGTYKLHNL